MKVKVRKKVFLTVIITLLLLITGGVFWLLHPSNQEYEELGMRPAWTLSENISSGAQNTVFAQLMTQVGYTKFLQEEGPYTVFVPTDAAYKQLTDETKSALNQDEGILRSVLLFHVVKGRYELSDLKDGMELETVQGETIRIKKEGKNWSLNDYSYIETYDIIGKNGVIHMVTNYLLPQSLTQVP